MKKLIEFSFVFLVFFMLATRNSDGQDEILFRKHIIHSGINGLFYGIAIDIIAELDGGAAAGVPVIAAGVSGLVPLFTNSSRTITPNSYVLSGHGKVLGWVHGFALATLIGGENAWNNNNYKLTIGLGAATSIGLGILGNSLGRNKNWTEGRAELYRHYGWIMPFTGISIVASFSEEPRLYGASVLLFGAGGYFLADKIYNWHEFTIGDIRATQVLSLLNGGLGYGILADKGSREVNFVRSDILFPAIGVVAGTLAGHLWLKNAYLTTKQGRQTAYATTGGAILGLGFALLTESDKPTPYYLLPYIAGLGAYTFAVESFKKKNNIEGVKPLNQKSNLEITFMPQNLYINTKMPNKGYLVNGRLIGMQPFFSASLRF